MGHEWRRPRSSEAVTLCMRKRRYEAAEAAELATKYTRANRAIGQGPCRAYLCPYCRGWHITRGQAGQRMQTLPTPKKPEQPATPKRQWRQSDFQKDYHNRKDSL
jgi:hypothetical protein